MTVGTALRRTGAVSGWTPASLSPYLWLDANQLVGLNDGDAISTFTDSSGNGLDFTSSGGNRPVYKTNIMNGKPVARFTASSSHYMSRANIDPGSYNMSMWVVCSATAGSDLVIFETSTNFNLNDGSFITYRASGNTANAGLKAGSGTTSFQTTGTVTTSPAAFLWTWDGSLSTNEIICYLNSASAAAGTRPSNANTNLTLSPYTGYLGSRAGSSLFFNGDIAEVGITASTLGSSDISSLMSYLGTKYGITIT